jgi:hypothetical protein
MKFAVKARSARAAVLEEEPKVDRWDTTFPQMPKRLALERSDRRRRYVHVGRRVGAHVAPVYYRYEGHWVGGEKQKS